MAENQKMFSCLLDLTAAEDRVSMPLLWDECSGVFRTVLKCLGVHGALLAAVQAMYSSATAVIRVHPRQGPQLLSLNGVRQGCPHSLRLAGLLADGLYTFLQAVARADNIVLTVHLTITDLG